MAETLCPAEHDLLALLSGEPDTAALKAHVDGCAECQRRLRRLQSGFSTLLLRAAGPGSPATGSANPPAGSSAAVGQTAVASGQPAFIGKYFVAGARPGSADTLTAYRAAHAFLKQEVVVHLGHKALPPDDDARRLLIGEGKKLLELNHPNLARVYDLDFHQDRPYLVEEYVDGLNLVEYVEQEKPTPQQAALLVAQLAEGLAAAHQRGLAHQRILPRDIVIDDTGRPRLTGFGVARLRELASGPAAPAPGTDACLDSFALGAILYFLLTGQIPPTTSSAGQSPFAPGQPGWTGLKTAGVPEELQVLCAQALSSSSAATPLNLTDFAQKLRRFAQGSQSSHLVLAICIGLFLLAAGIWWLLSHFNHP